VGKFKYLGTVFTSDGRQSKQIDTRIGKASSITWVSSFRGYKTRVFSHCKAASFWTDLCSDPHLYDHEPWVMSERTLSQVQAVTMGFYEKFMGWHFATKCAAVKFVKTRTSIHFYFESEVYGVWNFWLRLHSCLGWIYSDSEKFKVL